MTRGLKNALGGVASITCQTPAFEDGGVPRRDAALPLPKAW